MNSMTYKGYTARIEFDARDNIFWGKVLGLPDSINITFEGKTVVQLTQDFHKAIDFYVEDCANEGKEPTKPASGKMMLRVPPEVHGSALIAAQAAGKSLNQWAAEVLKEAADA
ncbi:MAG: type II toxin-antitoxin system HicB family antitoxin [Rhodocyclaceae bacterium]|nr:MAG: type II toxin-antitoxin system HicB family antitoxin [Rhodocyclaceae bacterium]